LDDDSAFFVVLLCIWCWGLWNIHRRYLDINRDSLLWIFFGKNKAQKLLFLMFLSILLQSFIILAMSMVITDDQALVQQDTSASLDFSLDF